MNGAPGSMTENLHLCVQRLHGKRAHKQVVPIPDTGLMIGGENLFPGLHTSLHMTENHATISVSGGAYRIKPGTAAMLVALNGEKVPFPTGSPLYAGDRLEIGFATLLVEGSQRRELFGLQELPPPAAWPGMTNSFQAEAISSEPAEPHPPQDMHHAVQADSDAALLHALLLQDAQDPPPLGEDFYKNGTEPGAARYTGSAPAPFPPLHMMPDVLPNIGPNVGANMQSLAPAQQDILELLAIESSRALDQARGAPVFCENIAPLRATPCSSNSAQSVLEPSSAASLEEILHGPLTIDEVLDGLRRQHPATNTAVNGYHDQAGFEGSDTACALDTLGRTADPLRLLAGLDVPPPHEPVLAPVLHHEHRLMGMQSPYFARTAKLHTEDIYKTDVIKNS